MTICQLIKDHEPKHSEFQIKNFIIGGQGGDWFKYKQCLREIKSRVESLDSAEDQLTLFEIGKKSIKRKIKLLLMGETKRQIFLKSEKRSAVAMAENIKHTKRELGEFAKIAKQLKSKLGDIDTDKRLELESAAWIEKGRQMAAIEIMTMGGLSKTTMEFILSLPKESRRGILIEMKSIKPETILQIE